MTLYLTGLGTNPDNWKIIQIVEKDEDNFVCECDDPAMARELVRRYNAHNRLVNALQELHDACEFWENQDDPVLSEARNAIQGI